MKIKNYLALSVFILICYCSNAATGSFTVGGDFDKFYPVTFTDDGWSSNTPTTLELGRSSVHEDSYARGALMARFTYHVTNWGNGANFINADIRYSQVPFISDWMDPTGGNNNYKIIIWLRGGGTTYYYNSNYTITITVYDGVQNALPYTQTNLPSQTYETTVNPKVNSAGLTSDGNVYYNGTGTNYFAGQVIAAKVGIGTTTPWGDGNLTVQSVPTTLNSYPGLANLALQDGRAMDAGVGGGISLMGNYVTGTNSQTAFAGIQGRKTNAVSGDGQGNLDIWARGGSINFLDDAGVPGTQLMTILHSGNVGIGTVNPTDLFQVNNGSTMRFQVAAAKGVWVNNEINGGELSSPGDLYLNYSSAHNTLLNTNGGNVGIGTVNLSALLTIGSAVNRGTLNVVGNTTNPPAISITDSQTGGHQYSLYNGASSVGNLDIFDQTANAYRFQINANGNVGIGTTDSKGYKLAVAGNAIAESMTVKLQSDWPDYVFKPAYGLTPLSELKTYIDKNQHLPEIPSSAEVEKDGQNLGEMNKLLLKKVEELTLYLIEKDKQIKEISDQLKIIQVQLKQQK